MVSPPSSAEKQLGVFRLPPPVPKRSVVGRTDIIVLCIHSSNDLIKEIEETASRGQAMRGVVRLALVALLMMPTGCAALAKGRVGSGGRKKSAAASKSKRGAGGGGFGGGSGGGSGGGFGAPAASAKRSGIDRSASAWGGSSAAGGRSAL